MLEMPKKALLTRAPKKLAALRRSSLPSQVDFYSDVCLLRAMVEIHVYKVCATFS